MQCDEYFLITFIVTHFSILFFLKKSKKKKQQQKLKIYIFDSLALFSWFSMFIKNKSKFKNMLSMCLAINASILKPLIVFLIKLTLILFSFEKKSKYNKIKIMKHKKNKQGAKKKNKRPKSNRSFSRHSHSKKNITFHLS